MAARKTPPARRRTTTRRAPQRNDMSTKPESSTGFIDPNKTEDADNSIDIFAENEGDDVNQQVENAIADVYRDAQPFPVDEPTGPEEPTIAGELEEEEDERQSYDAGSYMDNPVHKSHHFAFETADRGPLHIEGLKIDQNKYEVRMIRCMDGGVPDTKNLNDARANGYTPVPIDQLPGDRRALSASGGVMGGVYRVKDSILMWRPMWIARKHVAAERKAASDRREAIIRQLKTSMPKGTRMHSPDFNFKGVRGREATDSIQEALDGTAEQVEALDDVIAQLRESVSRE